MDKTDQNDTIVALATPCGQGGIGIVRVSGRQVKTIAQTLVKKALIARQAQLSHFITPKGDVIDLGIAILFEGPYSFTGEDIVEFQCHGGPVVLEQIIEQVTKLGARLAHPGEFSYRAFINGKQDLLQLEASCDLIGAASVQAAKMALSSMRGAFSQKVNQVIERVIALRVMVESAIDFSDEDIELAGFEDIHHNIEHLSGALHGVMESALQGCRVREGMQVTIMGAPNVGKSSLLNALSGQDSAIVTDIAGTTRDRIEQDITLQGVNMRLVDTAGLREQEGDRIEKEGMVRGMQAAKDSHHVLWMVEAHNHPQQLMDLQQQYRLKTPGTVVVNKIDLWNEQQKNTWEQWADTHNKEMFTLSLKEEVGIGDIRRYLSQLGRGMPCGENGFIARKRHLDALSQAKVHLDRLQTQPVDTGLEFLADDLLRIQQCLESITGRFVADDLLDVIFKQFCIGK